MSTRTTLKTYFVTGATPTEAQFAAFIDSAVNVTDDLTASLALDDATKVLTADGAKALKDALDLIDTRVDTLEAGEVEFADDYYTKTEIDTRITSVGTTIDSVDSNNDAGAAALDVRVTSLESADAGFAALVHTHAIANVTDLQTALDAKATTASLTSEVSTINTAMLAKAASVHTHVLADITDLANIDLSLYATLVQLAGKADTGHTHTYSNITDIGDGFYTKAEVDSRVALVDTEHTHEEADVTDLDKYTQAQTDLRIADHDNLTNNPHAVTKAQVALTDVEDLDTTGIFASAAAATWKTANVTTVSDALDTHEAAATTPHAVTKTQVALGNVPNIDVKALLDVHEAATNPHTINLDTFDVFSEAETNARINYYISAKIYDFTPASTSDSAGALGDIAYDSALALNRSPAHIKVGSTNWMSLAPTNDPIFTTNVELEGSSGDLSFEIDNNAANSSNLKIMSGAGNARADFLLDGNLHITLKGQRVGILDSSPDYTLDVTGDGRFTSNLTGGGNLTILGTTTTVDTATLQVEDPIMQVNYISGAAQAGANSGMHVGRNGTTDASLIWDESSDTWKAGLAAAEVEIVDLSLTQTLTNKTLTSPVLNTQVSGTAVLDEDTMSTDSDTQLATQQSIKAYVLSQSYAAP